MNKWDQKRAGRRAEIAARFAPGVTGSTVSRALGASLPTALMDLRAMGWPVSGPGTPIRIVDSPERLAWRGEILRAVQAEPHRTLESFGEQFGVTRERVRQIVKQCAGTPKPNARFIAAAERRRAKAELKRAAVIAFKRDRILRWGDTLAMRARGMTYEQIGKECGVSFRSAYMRVQVVQADLAALRAQV